MIRMEMGNANDFHRNLEPGTILRPVSHRDCAGGCNHMQVCIKGLFHGYGGDTFYYVETQRLDGSMINKNVGVTFRKANWDVVADR